QLADFLAVRPRRHLHIRITIRRRFARRARCFLLGARSRHRRERLIERGLPATEVERPLLALARAAAPELAELVVARQQRLVPEAPRVVAHPLLADLVDVRLDVSPVLHRRNFGDAREELIVLVLQLADVLLEEIELVVLFLHGVRRRLQYAVW